VDENNTWEVIMAFNHFLLIVLLCFIGRTHGRQSLQLSEQQSIVSRTFGGRDVHDSDNHILRRSRECHLTYLQQDNNINLDTLFILRGGDVPTAQQTLLGQGSVVHNFLQAIDVFGTGVFAFAGALKAGKKGMDLLGMTITACITAVGGGTIRDLLMGTGGRGVFWMRNPLYIEICVVTTLATYILWPRLEKEFGFKDSNLAICTADAFGLAAFCVLGTQRAVRKNLAPTLWVASGVITSVFGGIIRDVICGEPPRVLYPYQTMYGAGPALGSFIYTLLIQIPDIETDLVASIAFLVSFTVRTLAFNRSWRLPHWPDERKGVDAWQ
jgi:uncharacterized membrane protein YeiH